MPLNQHDPQSDAAWLFDMLSAARAVRSFVDGRTLEEYLNDLLLRSAVERQIEIIGEAARGISNDFKARHPDIPWRQIMAQRHRLAHEYGEINDELIWRVATIHIVDLITLVEPLVPPAPPTGNDS